MTRGGQLLRLVLVRRLGHRTPEGRKGDEFEGIRGHSLEV
jgi:hypothetical protein